MAAASPASEPGLPWEPWEKVASGSAHAGRSHGYAPRGRAGPRTITEIQTGYQPSVLTHLWSGAADHFMRYRDSRSDGAWIRRTRAIWKAQHYFYALLMYIHLYPAEDNMPEVLVTRRLSVNYVTFYKMIVPSAHSWALIIDEIRWADRLALDNHHPFFPYLTTVIWDSTCFCFEAPTDWDYGRYIVNGHYDWPCFLVLLGIDFKGNIVFMSGLHRSTAYDANIFEDTRHLHPQFDWEMNLADAHFATVPCTYTPAQRTGGRELNPTEKVWNKMVQLPRSRVEHINTVLKDHKMFKQKYRGYVRNFWVFVKITGHATAVRIRHRAEDRYQGYGWWKHNEG